MNPAALGLGLLLWMGLPELPEPDPPIQDAMMFPGFPTANNNYQLAMHHLAWLETQATFYPEREIFFVVWIQEAKELCEIWHLVVEVVGQETDGIYNADEVKRTYLANLKALLGPRYYHQGVLPPPVPIWRFKRIE